VPFPITLAYPSDDLTTYQVGTDQPMYQAALADLLAASGSEQVYQGLRVPRYTQWTGELDGETVILKMMCSPTDPNWLSGPGTTQSAGGIDWTLTKCVGEQRP
jgi:hypothetical protein